MSGVMSLKTLCAPVPKIFSRPPAGSGLEQTIDAIERTAAREPATVKACHDMARKAIEAQSPPGWRPATSEQALAHELQVLRREVAMLKLLADAVQTPPAQQREAMAVMLTVRLYLMCGGQSARPGAHKLACDGVAKAFGVPADDVSTLVGKFFDATGRIGSHDTYVSDEPTFMRLLSATLKTVDDLLLSHTPWIGAAAAANEAEEFERRYQPVH